MEKDRERKEDERKEIGGMNESCWVFSSSSFTFQRFYCVIVPFVSFCFIIEVHRSGNEKKKHFEEL